MYNLIFLLCDFQTHYALMRYFNSIGLADSDRLGFARDDVDRVCVVLSDLIIFRSSDDYSFCGLSLAK